MEYEICLRVNGKKIRRRVKANTTLLDFLRKDLGFTGTKEGCGVGECGACTVIVDGECVRSCLVLAVEMDGKEVTTIEGIAKDGKLSPVQKAFIDRGAIQCGFCTPGFVVATENLYKEKPNPTKEDVLEAFEGHLCRCTGYEAILDAALNVKEYQES